MAEVSRTHGLEKTPKDGTEKTAAASQAPTITLPRGGGAIRGIGEKFGVNPVTGTSSMTVPLMTSPGRSGFSPQLTLSYDSGAGNGPFGLGWSLSLPTITRKTDKSLPQYIDAEESDVFLLSGAEDLVPILKNGESIGPHLEPDDLHGSRNGPIEQTQRIPSGDPFPKKTSRPGMARLKKVVSLIPPTKHVSLAG
jgi:hypothetical protein